MNRFEQFKRNLVSNLEAYGHPEEVSSITQAADFEAVAAAWLRHQHRVDEAGNAGDLISELIYFGTSNLSIWISDSDEEELAQAVYQLLYGFTDDDDDTFFEKLPAELDVVHLTLFEKLLRDFTNFYLSCEDSWWLVRRYMFEDYLNATA